MILEAKHLIAYLPYGVKVKSGKNTIRELAYEMKHRDNPYKFNSIPNILNGVGHNLILKPLKDIVNDSEIMDEFSEYHWNHFEISFLSELQPLNKFDHVSYAQAELILKKHYDLFGLIPNGLAIADDEK